MTPVRTVAGIGAGSVLMSVLAGCSSDTTSEALIRSAPISSAPSASASATPVDGSTPEADGLFSGSTPVSIVSWWQDNPASAPPDLAKRTLLFNEQGIGPSRFLGPDMRKFSQVLMVITCTSKVEYDLRLQVLDGLSIATSSGGSCGGPDVSSYVSPTVKVVDPKTEVQVEVPTGTKYYVTIYGTPVK